MKKILYILFLLPFLAFSQEIELVGHLPLHGSIGFDVWGYEDTINDRQYALMGQDHYLKIIDVTDPYNPDSVSSVTMLNDTMFAFDQKVWDHYLYVVDGYNEDGMRAVVYDIEDIENPVFLDTIATAHNITIDDNGFMYASCKGLKIYDLKPDPVSPTLVWTNGQNGLDCHDVLITGNRLFDFEGFKHYNVTEYDITDPTNPVAVDSLLDWDIEFTHSGALTQDSILLVCDEYDEFGQDDITIWNLNNEPNPKKIGGFNDPDNTVHNIYAIDTLLYVSYYKAGFRVMSIADPANIYVIDEFLTDTLLPSDPNFAGAFGCYPFGKDGLIYVSDRANGLFIFKFNDGSQVGLDEWTTATKMSVFPNPAQEEISVSLPHTNFERLTLNTIQGRQLATWNVDQRTELRLSLQQLQLQSGVYFLRATSPTHTLTTQCIIHLND